MCIAVILTIGFVLVAVGVIGPNSEPETKGENITVPNFDTIPKTASLYFSPPVLNNPSGPTQVDVIVETGGQEISGTQLELQFNPEVLRNVEITSPQNSFFGTPSDYKILLTNVDSENGTISFTVAAADRSKARKGNGKIATISFVTSSNSEIKNTSLTFAPTTLVTIFGANQTVLKEAAGLTIILDQTLSQAQ